MKPDREKGVLYAVAAYLIWGLFPIYWKQLAAVPALQLIGHRIVWSCVLLVVVLLVTRQFRSFLGSLTMKTGRVYFAAAVLISINWFVYVWAITHDLVVEASLGYFINPLLSVLLGVLLFRERLRPFQWLPIALALGGVAYLTISLGSPPWVALVLAVTFGLYGAVKKTAPLNALFGLTAETGILLVPAVLFLVLMEANGTGMFLHRPATESILMVGGGVITAIPLLLFAGATVRVPLTTIGLLQYLTPTMQFLIGALMYHEPLPTTKLIGFGLVWIALLVFWGDNWRTRNRGHSLGVVAD
ncbi:MAG TPA: EamA family transporter RarD [Anaerolineales bacterium]|nr:EamA family transporter RarD [Anaerolineales bacterium]